MENQKQEPDNTTEDTTPVLKKVKKIRSILIRDGKPNPNEPALKKYKTFTNSSKQLILVDIKKKVIPNSDHDFDHKKDSKELIRTLAKLDLNEYNNLLSEVLTKNLGSFNPSTKNLTLWRRKIKNWLQNISKPEKRGGVLISDDKFGKFRVKLVEILTSMNYRVFGTLRERILVVLEEVYNQEQEEMGRKCYKPFNKNTCSKHWWFNFQRRYPEIKRLWERLPLERSLSKHLKPDSPGPDHFLNDAPTKKVVLDKDGKPDAVKEESEPLTAKAPYMPMPLMNIDLASLVLPYVKNEPIMVDEASTNVKSENEIKVEPMFEIPPPIYSNIPTIPNIQPVKVLQPIQESFKPVVSNTAKEPIPYIHDNDAPIIMLPSKPVETPKPAEPVVPRTATEKAKEHFSEDFLARINEIVMQALIANKDKLLGGDAQQEAEVIKSLIPVPTNPVPNPTPKGKIVEERVVTTETKTVYRTIYDADGQPNTTAVTTTTEVVKSEEN